MGFLILVGACVGNTAMLAFSLNCLYGTLLNRTVLGALRTLHGLLVLALPAAWALVFGLDLAALREGFPAAVPQAVLALHLGLAALVGLVVVPVVTVRRWFLVRPAALTEERSTMVDVAGALGYRPVGRGKHRHLARLPFNGLFQVEFTERTLELPGLPPTLDGLTLLHLTDLHFSGTPDRRFFQYVMDRCREWESDVLALTGDIVDSRRHHSWVLPVLGRLRWKVAAYAVLGNHDSWYEPDALRRRLERLGFRVLGNRWERLEVRGQEVAVIGNEVHWFRPAPDLSGCPTDLFRLCLSHTPDNLPWARRNRIDLMLAGHNHGGQIRVPLLGSILVPSRFSRRFDCGTFHEPPTVLHVGRGLAGQHPLRYFCRPEVVRLTLRCPSPPSVTSSAAPRREGVLARSSSPPSSVPGS